MANQRGVLQIVLLNETSDIVGHGNVVMVGIVRRVPMVA
jgi:hypothetical protein